MATPNDYAQEYTAKLRESESAYPAEDLMDKVLALKNLSTDSAQGLTQALNANPYLRTELMRQGEWPMRSGTLVTYTLPWAAREGKSYIKKEKEADKTYNMVTKKVAEAYWQPPWIKQRAGYKKKRKRRKYVKRKSTKRKSTRRKSVKRKSVKRKSTKRRKKTRRR
tara:strand:+ start:32960 stop:33457 length:498 start_codon:yes stop_codon:yes gene_type:complete